MSKLICFTEEQQKAYDGLSEKQKKYVDYRAAGYPKNRAYEAAGYKGGKCSSQNAAKMEKDNVWVKELSEIKRKAQYVGGLTEKESAISKTIDALADSKRNDKVMDIIAKGDKDQIERIKFYKDIINGKTKSKKTVTTTDSEGKKSKREEVSISVETQIKARQELDRILGLSAIIDVGTVQFGNIQVTIVDASKEEELLDERNKIGELNAEDIEETQDMEESSIDTQDSENAR